MPRLIDRPIGLGGMGDIKSPPDLLGDRWRDCDKALVLDGPRVTPWMGHQRAGMKIFDATLHGAASNRFDVLVMSQHYMRRKHGAGLAIVDCETDCLGRVVGGAYHSGGIDGDKMRSVAVRTTGSGLHDLEIRGIWTGGTLTSALRGVLTVKIISGAASPDTKAISTDGGTTYGSTTNIVAGEWFTIGNGIEGRFLAAEGHTTNDVFTITAGGRPMKVGSLNRQGPHQYPKIFGSENTSLIFDEWNRVQVYDGSGEIRDAGLEAPYIKPSVRAQLSITDGEVTTSSSDIGLTDVDPTGWVAVSPVTISRQTATPDPADGTAYLELTIPYSLHRGKVNLAYVDTAGTLNASLRRVRVYLRGEFSHGVIKDGRLALAFASGAGLTGTVKYATVRSYIRGSRWIRCDCEIRPGSVDFTYASIGLRMTASIPSSGSVYNSSNNLVLYMDRIDTEAASGGGGTPTTQASSVLTRDGEFQFGFTWYSRLLQRESAMSPASDSIKLDSSAARLDLSGWFPGIQAGLQNSAPEWADSVKIYVANTTWGQDERLGRGLPFFRFGPKDGIELSKLSDAESLDQLIVDVSDEDAFGKINDANLNEKQPFYNALPMPGRIAAMDGTVIVSAGQGAYMFKFTVTNGSGLVTPYSTGNAETTAIIGKWMEGRRFHRLGDTKIYRVVKAMDTDADGVLDALWVATDYDATIQEFTTLYQGVTGTGVDCVIVGQDEEIAWTNHTAFLGVDAQASSPLSRARPFQGTDKPGGIIKLDENLFILGYTSAAIYRQLTDALEDQPVVGLAPNVRGVIRYSSPAIVRGPSCVAADTCCVGPDGTGYWLGTLGQLYMSNGGPIAEHPLSPIISAILSGKGFLSDSVSLKYSWGAYFENEFGKFLYFGIISTPKAIGVSFAESAEDDRVFDGEDDAGVPAVIEDAGTTYEYPWKEDGPIAWSDGTMESAPSAEWLEFSPRPWVEGGGDSIGHWTDPWGNDLETGNDGNGEFSGSGLPYTAWRENGVTANEIDCSLADFPAALAEESGENPEWPSPGALTPHYHAYVFNKSSCKCYKFHIQTGADANDFVTSCDVRIAGEASTPLRVIPSTTQKLGFWAYSDKVLASGKLSVVFMNAYAGEGAMQNETWIINTALAANAWTWVEIDLVANPPVGGWATPSDFADPFYEDKDAGEISGLYYDAIKLTLLSAVAENTNLYITGGRLIFNEYASNESGAAVDPLMDVDCSDYSGEIEQNALAADYEAGILVDLGRGLVLTGSECRFTRPLTEPGAGCSVAGQSSGQRFWGTRDNYIHRVMDTTWLSWGHPSSRFIYAALASGPGGAATFIIDQTAGGYSSAIELPTDIDGNGTLAGLVACKLSADNSWEVRRISSNTTTTATVSANWTTAPVATDKLIVGFLPAVLHSGEVRTQFESMLKEFSANIHEEISPDSHADTVAVEPIIKSEVYSAQNGEYQSNLSDGAQSDRVASRSDFEQGDGFLDQEPVSSKARSNKFTFFGGQTGRVHVSNLQVRERVHDREQER